MPYIHLSQEEIGKLLQIQGLPDFLAFRMRERQVRSEYEEEILSLAHEQSVDGQLEFDEDAIVSMGDDNGAYVLGWYWIDFKDTPLDKGEDNEED